MRSIFSYWHFDWITTIFIIGLCVLYFYIINFKLKKQSLYFFSGIILLIVCLSSPLHFIGQNYLFSVHVLSHVLIILIAAPLIVAGIPAENKLKRVFFFLSKRNIPFICWLTGVVMMWFWHVPYIFNHLFSLHNTGNMPAHSMSVLMYIEMLSLLIGGIIFCLPIINPYREHHITPLKGVLYLSSACVFCSILGLLITFAPLGIYTPYLNIRDTYGYLTMIRNGWGISAGADQQMAGLIMWVPCCILYLTASMVLIIKEFNTNYPNYANYTNT